MSKIIILIVVFILQSLFFIPAASAASCNFTYSPTSLNQDMDKLTVTITSPDLPADTYRLELVVPGGDPVFTKQDLSFSAAGISVEFSKPGFGWRGGEYKLYLIKHNRYGDRQKIADCSTAFTVAETAAQSSCTSKIENTQIDPDTNVVLVINGITSGSYDLCINDRLYATYETKIGNRIDLAKHPVGTHTVKIKNGNSNCSPLERIQCGIAAFEVAPRGGGGGPVTPGSPRPAGFPTSSFGDWAKCNGGSTDPGIRTAIGCIRTSPVGFIKDFLKFIIGISGGLAFLMMLLGAFQMLSSAGNPETLQAGRERLTSAIIGLLFVIFAVLLLQIIGFDILKIPGFGR